MVRIFQCEKKTRPIGVKPATDIPVAVQDHCQSIPVATAVAMKSLGIKTFLGLKTIPAAPPQKGDVIHDELSEGIWKSRNDHRIEGWKHEEVL
jgi:hypothetical protein